MAPLGATRPACAHHDLGTPNHLWAAMVRIWRSGLAPVDKRIIEDIMNWPRNVRWIIKAGGGVVPELNVRSGRWLAKRKQTREENARRRRAAKARQDRSDQLRARVPKRATLMQHFRPADYDDEDGDKKVAAAAKEHGMIPADELLASYRPPTYEQIMKMGRDDSPKQLNGKGLRTRLKVLGKSTNGGASVLRQRLCEALEVSAAPPAAAASAAAAAAVPTAAAAAPPAAAAAAAAAVMMDLAD
jgi:hypothetical protein